MPTVSAVIKILAHHLFDHVVPIILPCRSLFWVIVFIFVPYLMQIPCCAYLQYSLIRIRIIAYINYISLHGTYIGPVNLESENAGLGGVQLQNCYGFSNLMGLMNWNQLYQFALSNYILNPV